MLCRGATVCVAGEWNGDTGDAELEAQLRGSFRLTHRLALPNWTDTVHELTIWQRATVDGDGAPVVGHNLLPVACSGCSTGCSGDITPANLEASTEPVAGIGAAGGGGMQALRRCRFCREVAYCSAACAEADSKRHAEVHAMRLMFFQDHQVDDMGLPDADYAPLRQADS